MKTMSKLLTIKDFIIKTSNYLFYLIKKIVFFPFKLIIQFLDLIFSEMLSITFKDIVKFALVFIVVKFGFTLFRLIIMFALLLAGVSFK